MAKRRTRRRLTAKQLAAGFGGKRYKKNPRRRTHHRKAARSVARRTYRRNPARRHSSGSYRRRARVYAGRASNFLSRYGLDTIMPASVGAAGALGLDMLWGYLPIPAAVQTGPLAPVVRLAGAFGIGALAGMAFGKKFGRDVTTGATVVTMYDLIKGWLKTNYPSLPGLQGVGMYVGHRGGHRGRRGYYDPRLGMYVGRYNAAINLGPAGLGEYTPDYVNEYTTDSSGIAYGANPEPGM